MMKKIITLTLITTTMLFGNSNVETIFDLNQKEYKLENSLTKEITEEEKIKFALNRYLKVLFFLKTNIETDIKYENLKKEKNRYYLENITIKSKIANAEIKKMNFEMTEEFLISNYEIYDMKNEVFIADKIIGENEDIFYKIIYSNNKNYPKTSVEYISNFYGMQYLDTKNDILDLTSNYEVTEDAKEVINKIGAKKYDMLQTWSFIPDKNNLKGNLNVKVKNDLSNIEIDIEAKEIKPKTILVSFFGNNDVLVNKIKFKIDKTKLNKVFFENINENTKKEINNKISLLKEENNKKIEERTKYIKDKKNDGNLKFLELFQNELFPFLTHEKTILNYELTTKEDLEITKVIFLYQLITTGRSHILKDIGKSIEIKKLSN